MTDEQREALVSHWLEVELDEAEDGRALAGHISQDYREGVWHVLHDQFEEADEALVTNNWRIVEHEADALLQSAGLPPLDHAGADFIRLCRRLLLAKQEYTRIEADRWEGKYINKRAHAAALPPTPTGKPNAVAPAAGPLFSVVMEKFLAETPRAARSARPLKVELLKFMELIGGDKPMTAISPRRGHAGILVQLGTARRRQSAPADDG
jgi:hypothetical protein